MINFLPKDRVMDDHERFAEQIKLNYNVFDCKVYQEDTQYMHKEQEIPVKSIGYQIDKDGKQHIVTKLFVEDSTGQLSALPHDFSVTTDGKLTHSQLYSLGDVFQALGIHKSVIN